MPLKIEKTNEWDGYHSYKLNISLDGKYTVRSFMREAIKNYPKHWGRFWIMNEANIRSSGDINAKYKNGHLIEINGMEKFLDKEIRKVEGTQSYNCFDYDFYLKEPYTENSFSFDDFSITTGLPPEGLTLAELVDYGYGKLIC